jgi:NAD(P)-dependent dehydrogenase (short-subunit alcohol dehydrogenase family)
VSASYAARVVTSAPALTSSTEAALAAAEARALLSARKRMEPPLLTTCGVCSGRGVGLVAPGSKSCAHCAYVASGAPFYRPPPSLRGAGGGLCSLTGVAWLVALFAVLIMVADERRLFGGRANPHALADMRGRVVLVTGVSRNGLGLETAAQLFAQGARVVVTGRDRARLDEAAALVAAADGRGGKGGGAVDASLPLLDLADLSSVRAFAAAALAAHPRIDVLVLNAGVMAVPRLERTADGLERTWATNHVGHFLLARLLAPALELSAAETGDARVIAVSSGAARGGDLSPRSAAVLDANYTRGRAYGTLGVSAYCHSKLANCVFAAELARRAAGSGLRAFSLHPGGVYTELFRTVPLFAQLERAVRPILRALLKTPREGAQTQLFLATAPVSELHSGGYYDDCRRVTDFRAHPQLEDAAVGRALWEATEAVVKAM